MNFEEYLSQNGKLTYSNVGTSMLPLLRRGKDAFTVVKKEPERCKKGDVVLYKRPPKQFVLHRIVEVRKDDYVILGDNCVRKEYGIKDEDILGIMTEYSRAGKLKKITDSSYKTYTWWILHTIPVRTFVKRILLLLRRIAKRILKRK